MSPYSPLATRIRQELVDLRRIVDRSARLLDKAASRGDPDYLDGVALALHGFYSGVEMMLGAIARDVDQSLPEGPDWHRDLLLQAGGQLKGVRGPVLTPQTRHCLETYRGFRQIVRNVYTYNLDADRIRELAQALPACFEQVTEDLTAFAAFLDFLD